MSYRVVNLLLIAVYLHVLLTHHYQWSSQVKFIVKRISTTSSSNPQNPSGANAGPQLASTSGHHAATYSSLSRGRRARRRNSRLSSSSSQQPQSRPPRSSSAGSSIADTLHPNALVRAASSSGSQPGLSGLSGSTSDIERLMRIILTQGETIHAQLKRLQEREGQVT